MDPTVVDLLHHYGKRTDTLARLGQDLSPMEILNQPYFLAHSARQAAQAQIGIIRANEFRRALQGEITPIDVDLALPYQHPLTRIRLSGEELNLAVQQSTQNLNAPLYKPFLIFSGLRFTLHGPQAQNIEVEERPGHWAPLDPKKTYSVGLCRYLVEKDRNFRTLHKPHAIDLNSTLTLADVMCLGLRQLKDDTPDTPLQLPNYLPNPGEMMKSKRFRRIPDYLLGNL